MTAAEPVRTRLVRCDSGLRCWDMTVLCPKCDGTEMMTVPDTRTADDTWRDELDRRVARLMGEAR